MATLKQWLADFSAWHKSILHPGYDDQRWGRTI